MSIKQQNYNKAGKAGEVEEGLISVNFVRSS